MCSRYVAAKEMGFKTSSFAKCRVSNHPCVSVTKGSEKTDAAGLNRKTALEMAHDMAHAMYTRGTSPHYSSVMFNRSYPTPTLAAPTPIGQNPTPTPGTKWSTKKFDSGIHASAANERYLAMRRDAEDIRPFKGAPYQPANTFVTTGPWRQGTVPRPFSRGKHCPNPLPRCLLLLLALGLTLQFALSCVRAAA